LVFPHLGWGAIDGFGKVIPESVIWGMKGGSDEKFVITPNRSPSNEGISVVGEKVPSLGVKFASILSKCDNLTELEIPIYWYGLHMLEFISKESAKNIGRLVLVGYCSNERVHPNEPVTRFRNEEIKPRSFSNLTSLVLADFLLRNSFELVDRLVFCHNYPVLNNLHFHGFDDIGTVPRLLTKLTTTLEGLSFTTLPGFSYHSLPVMRGMHIAEKVSRLSLCCTLCSHGYNLMWSTFPNLTSVTLHLLPEVLNRLSLTSIPNTVKEFTLVHTTRRPESKAPLRVIRPIGACAITREIFRFLEKEPKGLISVKLRWITMVSDITLWAIMSFCLIDYFQRMGIKFEVDLRIVVTSDAPIIYVNPQLSLRELAVIC